MMSEQNQILRSCSTSCRSVCVCVCVCVFVRQLWDEFLKAVHKLTSCVSWLEQASVMRFSREPQTVSNIIYQDISQPHSGSLSAKQIGQALPVLPPSSSFPSTSCG